MWWRAEGRGGSGRRPRRRRPLPCAWRAVGRVMPGQLPAAAGGFLGGQARGPGFSPAFCRPFPPPSSNVCPHPASPHFNTSWSCVLNLGMGIQRPRGTSPCLRIVYSLWSGWKQDIPYVLHQSAGLRVGYGTRKHTLTGSGVDTAPGFSLVPVVNVYFIRKIVLVATLLCSSSLREFVSFIF